jgi:hypothetical protein
VVRGPRVWDSLPSGSLFSAVQNITSQKLGSSNLIWLYMGWLFVTIYITWEMRVHYEFYIKHFMQSSSLSFFYPLSKKQNPTEIILRMNIWNYFISIFKHAYMFTLIITLKIFKPNRSGMSRFTYFWKNTNLYFFIISNYLNLITLLVQKFYVEHSRGAKNRTKN